MLQDMLIQSWGEKIRIFPGVSKEWEEAVFHNLRAEGGFEISAKRENGKTVWVRIRNNTGEACILEPGFEGNFSTKGGKIKMLAKNLYRIKIVKGEEAVLYANEDEGFEVTPVQSGNEAYNAYGLK